MLNLNKSSQRNWRVVVILFVRRRFVEGVEGRVEGVEADGVTRSCPSRALGRLVRPRRELVRHRLQKAKLCFVRGGWRYASRQSTAPINGVVQSAAPS